VDSLVKLDPLVTPDLQDLMVPQVQLAVLDHQDCQDQMVILVSLALLV